MPKPEIMSPAGDQVSLQAAINAGCDAVYFGVEGLNMRAAAKNFTIDVLPEISALCHKNNVKVYLTLNVIVYESELEIANQILVAAKKAEIDAVICWDFAVIQMSKKIGLPVFLSTQMSVSNSESLVSLYKNFGIKRFVLARECSLDDIIKIQKNFQKKLGQEAEKIEIEVFVHGAMCVSVSGRCFLSQNQIGKSGNRGECVQPCRREYLITDKEGEFSYQLENNYILSPKDLCALPFIEELIEAGISSFKIEGRNRNPEYVSIVTAVYRKAVDFYFENKLKENFKENFETLKKELTKEVEKVYHRGFSNGFFLGKPVNEWTKKYGSSSSTYKLYSGTVKKYFRKPGVAEIKIENEEFNIGDEIIFQGPTTGSVSQIAESIEIEHQQIQTASRGQLIAVKTFERVRPNDRVFVVRSREIKQN